MFKSAHEFVSQAKQLIKECSPEEVLKQITAPDVLIVDVREPDEYRQGHLAGSVNIPRGMLEFKISNEPALQNVGRAMVLYCKTSGRAALASVALKNMGFENVVSMSGGFDAWVAAGLPVAKPREMSFE